MVARHGHIRAEDKVGRRAGALEPSGVQGIGGGTRAATGIADLKADRIKSLCGIGVLISMNLGLEEWRAGRGREAQNGPHRRENAVGFPALWPTIKKKLAQMVGRGNFVGGGMGQN